MNWMKFLITAIALGFAAQAGAQLPDFTRLVEEQGAAVVNISTTQSARRQVTVPPFCPSEQEG